MGVFELHNAAPYHLGYGVAPQTPIPLYPIGQQRCFWIPRMGVFGLQNAKKILFGFWGGAPNAHTTVIHSPAKVVLDTWDGGVRTAQCQKILFGFWGGAANTHTTVLHRPAKVFLDTYNGGV